MCEIEGYIGRVSVFGVSFNGLNGVVELFEGCFHCFAACCVGCVKCDVDVVVGECSFVSQFL